MQDFHQQALPASFVQLLEVLNRNCGLHVQAPICARCQDLALLFGEFSLGAVQPTQQHQEQMVVTQHTMGRQCIRPKTFG